MRVMVRALDQANQNTQNGSAMMKVAEGAVANTIEILKTLKEKAINAATDTNTDDDRKTIQKEIDQFIDQINDNALATFNGKYLVDGSKSAKTVSTSTFLFNQNLSTKTGADSVLSTLLDRAGNSLNIASDDTVTITWVSQGGTTTSEEKAGSDKLSDIIKLMTTGDSDAEAKIDTTTGEDTKITDTAGSKINPVSGEAGVIVYSGEAGTAAQITGFTISVVDKYGNTRKAANEFLEFKTEIFAANENADNALKIHVGAAAGQSISIGLADMRAEALGLQDAAGNVIKVSDPKKANGAIAAFDNALQKALDQATTIGAIEARLEYTSNNLTTESENVQAAESTIRDADMAKEMTNYTKNNVLLQAAQSMLAQANQNSSAVLSLLQ
jgi:flagellin